MRYHARRVVFSRCDNELRNIVTSLLKEVCKDVATEEEIIEKTDVLGEEARLDIFGRGFWQTGQMAFFDIRVFNPVAKRYDSQSIVKHEIDEKDKKKAYNR